jgi:hypothetical protein
MPPPLPPHASVVCRTPPSLPHAAVVAARRRRTHLSFAARHRCCRGPRRGEGGETATSAYFLSQ